MNGIRRGGRATTETSQVNAIEPKEALTRQRILTCALAMIDREGLEDLSMRKLATELDVAPMSLYNHVPNKDALLEGVAETMLGLVDLAALDIEDWSEALKAGIKGFRSVLLAHPNAVPLIETKHVVSPEYFRPVEASLEILRRAGFDPQEAMHAHWLVVSLTFGHVMAQITNPICNPNPANAVAMREANLPADEFPNLMGTLPYIIDYDFDTSFDYSLETVIEGLKTKLRRRPV